MPVMRNEIILHHVPLEGWYVIVKRGEFFDGNYHMREVARRGPLKNKPTEKACRRMQWRYFSGQQVDVILEE